MTGLPAVSTSVLPQASRLRERIAPGDFLDCYSVESGLSARAAAQIIAAFPGWVRGLMQVRRALTAPFGLVNDGPEAGDRIGFFPVTFEAADEVIAGSNDRHLDFRISVMSRDGRIHLATWVHPHNFGGRVYLATIYPFHVLVVRNGLARVAAATTSDAAA